MKKKLSSIILVTLSLFLITCKKDTPVPNQSLDKLFGTWTWVQSTGGIGGETTTPATEGYTKKVEFDKNGIYKWFKNSKQQDRMKFTLCEGSSIHTTGTAYLIKYEDVGLFDKKDHLETQSVTFGERDSLFLNDECWDCYQNVYVKDN